MDNSLLIKKDLSYIKNSKYASIAKSVKQNNMYKHKGKMCCSYCRSNSIMIDGKCSRCKKSMRNDIKVKKVENYKDETEDNLEDDTENVEMQSFRTTSKDSCECTICMRPNIDYNVFQKLTISEN